MNLSFYFNHLLSSFFLKIKMRGSWTSFLTSMMSRWLNVFACSWTKMPSSSIKPKQQKRAMPLSSHLEFLKQPKLEINGLIKAKSRSVSQCYFLKPTISFWNTAFLRAYNILQGTPCNNPTGKMWYMISMQYDTCEKCAECWKNKKQTNWRKKIATKKPKEKDSLTKQNQHANLLCLILW